MGLTTLIHDEAVRNHDPLMLSLNTLKYAHSDSIFSIFTVHPSHHSHLCSVHFLFFIFACFGP